MLHENEPPTNLLISCILLERLLYAVDPLVQLTLWKKKYIIKGIPSYVVLL